MQWPKDTIVREQRLAQHRRVDRENAVKGRRNKEKREMRVRERKVLAVFPTVPS